MSIMETFTSLSATFAVTLGILALLNPIEGQGGNETAVINNSSDTTEADLDFNQVRYHTESQKYYGVGSTEPCSENMRFFAVPNETRNGQCDCDYYQCSRPLLYNKKTGSCHLAWSRGPCEEGEWYTFTDNFKAICEKNSCPESPATSTSNYYFKNPEDGKCYDTGAEGNCKSGEGLMIYPNKPIPVCRSFTVCYPLSIPAQQLCIQGNRRHHDGFCESEFS